MSRLRSTMRKRRIQIHLEATWQASRDLHTTMQQTFGVLDSVVRHEGQGFCDAVTDAALSHDIWGQVGRPSNRPADQPLTGKGGLRKCCQPLRASSRPLALPVLLPRVCRV